MNSVNKEIELFSLSDCNAKYLKYNLGILNMTPNTGILILHLHLCYFYLEISFNSNLADILVTPIRDAICYVNAHF